MKAFSLAALAVVALACILVGMAALPTASAVSASARAAHGVAKRNPTHLHVETPHGSVKVGVAHGNAAVSEAGEGAAEESSESAAKGEESSESAAKGEESSESAAKGEESSESAESSESGESGESGMGSLKFDLGPEPAAATSYQPGSAVDTGSSDTGSNGGNHNSNSWNNDNTLDDFKLPTNNQGCHTNCEAEEAHATQIRGPMTVAEGIMPTNPDWVKVPQTDTHAEPAKVQVVQVATCGCNVCPCPTAQKVVHVVTACGCSVCPCQTLQSNTPAAVVATPLSDEPSPAQKDEQKEHEALDKKLADHKDLSAAAAVSDDCKDDECEKAKNTPEARAKREEQLKEQHRQERDSTKENLHKDVSEHMDNLAKIRQMTSALRYQYAELRRHHDLLREQISHNKMQLNLLDKDLKGSAYDIEGPAPPSHETLDDIPAASPDIVPHDSKKKVTIAQLEQKLVLCLSHLHQRNQVNLHLKKPTQATDPKCEALRALIKALRNGEPKKEEKKEESSEESGGAEESSEESSEPAEESSEEAKQVEKAIKSLPPLFAMQVAQEVDELKKQGH